MAFIEPVLAGCQRALFRQTSELTTGNSDFAGSVTEVVAATAVCRPAAAPSIRWRRETSMCRSLANGYRISLKGSQRKTNMCDQDHFDNDRKEFEAGGLVTRKQFGVMLGAGVAMMLPKVANAVAVTESEVTVKTPDGTADCYFVHPASGTAAGVLLWPDIFGLRPAMRQMGKRLAESGYSVLVVNPFYRAQKAPTATAGAATPIADLMPLMRALNETTQMTDAKAFIGWLDQQPSVDRNRKMGTQGYCMSGPIAFRTAAAVPDRVGAVASFHGGGLVTDAPNS